MAQYLKNRTTYSFEIITLSYVALAISTVIEHLLPELTDIAPYTLIVALALQLTAIMLLPSYFAAPLRRAVYYLINLGALTLTLAVTAHSIYFLIIEILLLLIFYMISYRAYQSLRLSFSEVRVSPEEYLESITFNLLRLNNIQFVFNVAALFIIELLPEFSASLYSLAIISSVLAQLRLHFKQRIRCSNAFVFLLSCLSSLGALCFAYFVNLPNDYLHAVVTALIFVPYTSITYLLRKEFRGYLKKYRYFSA